MISRTLSHLWFVIAPAMANHLWQSTLFLAVAGLLTLALRKNQARARYWLWLVASVKFLIPFSLLVVLGGYLALPRAATPSAQAGGLYAAVQEVAFIAAPSHSPALASAASPTGSEEAGQSWASELPAILLSIWFCGFIAVLLAWSLRWRRMRQVRREAISLQEGREQAILRRLERVAGVRSPIKILASHGSLEPGIFGVVRPALLWPDGISRNLSDGQIEAILAHEVWHVRRRDNLAAFIHMGVEAVFWFHPLVWWLGARMIEERERACDEAVVQLGPARRVYAESILKACEFCMAAPLACISGVTGADLKKRVVRIVTERPALKLDPRRKALLALAALLAVAVPVGFGLAKGKPGQANPAQRASSHTVVNYNDPRLSGQSNPAQSVGLSEAGDSTAARPKFEVASIKPNRSGYDKMNLMMSPNGRFRAGAMSAKTLIEFAYHLPSDDQIVGAPSWVNTEKFDIEAKADDAFVQKMHKMSFDEAGQQMRLMAQSLLADRFNLKASREIQQRPVYVLVVAKNGPKLTPTKLPDPGQMDARPPGPPGHGGAVGEGVRMRPGQLNCMGVAVSFLAAVLSRQPELGGRVVIDETGLKGRYDGTLTWTPEFQRTGMMGGPGPGPGPGAGAGGGQSDAMGSSSDSSGPSLFTALQQQLGLRLKPAKGSVEVLVIDHIEPPTPN